MSNLARKIRRKKEKQIKKDAEQNMKRQLALFKHLPDACSGCDQPFDKTSRDHHMTWKVRVYEEAQQVYLACPHCHEPPRGNDA
jgi:uncharacterized protein with PIN domain